MRSDSLAYLISKTLAAAKLQPEDIGYINAHGTGTQQNDVAESRAIRRAMGRAANTLCVSATKSILGHLVNAAGSVELAVTALAMRDGFVPPTLNLTHPDPECDLDCVPLVGRPHPFVSAMKLSVAFGGHLAAVVLRNWSDGQRYPVRAAVAHRDSGATNGSVSDRSSRAASRAPLHLTNSPSIDFSSCRRRTRRRIQVAGRPFFTRKRLGYRTPREVLNQYATRHGVAFDLETAGST